MSREDNTPTRRRDALIDIGVIVAACAVAVGAIHPPAPVDASAAPEQFSAERAMVHVNQLARSPRPVGSTGHAEAQQYVIATLEAQGLVAEVQETPVATGFAGWIRGATVRNVIAKLVGVGVGGDGKKTIMLAAHYDSVPNSPAASDNAAAVAALLETLRALRAGPPLKHDLLFFFGDGEELGLLGAAAFVRHHIAAGDVDLVLNFEARGNAGPSAMFETSAGNFRLIDELSQIPQRLYASSFVAALAKLLPNDTDLTVFKAAGIAGLNFAFADNLHRYHSATDNARRLDQGSLQHHGDYALHVARHFANSDGEWTADADAVYFDLFGATLVSYGPASAWLLALFGCGLLFATVVVARRRGTVTVRGCIRGGGVQILTLLACVFTVQGAAVAMMRVMPRNLLLDANRWFFVGYLAIALAVMGAIALWRWPACDRERWFGTALLWSAIGLATTAFAPAASYLFAWVVLFVAFEAALCLWVAPSHPRRAGIALLRAASTFMIATLVYTVFLVDGGLMPAAPILLAALAWGLVAEVFGALPVRTRRWIPLVSLALGIALLGLGSVGLDFDADNPRLSTVHYAVDADAGRSYWLSAPGEQDPWLAQFFRAGYERGDLPQFTVYDEEVVYADAPHLDLEPPKIEVEATHRQNAFRRIDLAITSPRGGSCFTVWRPAPGAGSGGDADSGAEITATEIGGQTVPTVARISTRTDARIVEFLFGVTRATWKLYYCGAGSEPVRLRLWTIPADEPLRLRIVDESFGLPTGEAFSIAPRPPASAPAQRSELILVSKAYEL